MRAALRLAGVLGLAGALALAATSALAEEPAKARDFCTDRPTKSTAPCILDQGRWQLESDVVNVTIQHDAGVRTETWLATSPTLKYGLSQRIDVELNITPWEQVKVTDHGTVSRASGFGDTVARLKIGLAGTDGGDFSAALAPFVKAPTARHDLGNGAWEGGLVTPLAWNLAGGWNLTVDPEADLLLNQSGSGRHLATAGLVSFTHAMTPSVSGSVELWGAEDFDPSGTTRQLSFDVGAAWIVPGAKDLQFDGGVNLGLNRQTPGMQAYVGVSKRF